MYNNIGNKIKALAKVICIFIAIIWVIVGFFLILNRYSSPFVRLVGILTIVVGPLSAWVGSFLLYGFGELIEQNAEINKEIKRLTKSSKEKEEKETEKKLFEKAIKGEEKDDECEDVSFYNPMSEE